jgi:hypothetical protein
MHDSPRRKTGADPKPRPKQERLETVAYRAFVTIHGDAEHLRPAAARGIMRAAAEAAEAAWTPDITEREWTTRTIEKLRQ